MDTVIIILKSFVLILLDALQLAMLLRAIMSWFDRGEPGVVSSFLIFITEPIIMPIRVLCERRHWFEGVMIDIPFFLTFMVLSLLQTFLMIL